MPRSFLEEVQSAWTTGTFRLLSADSNTAAEFIVKCEENLGRTFTARSGR